MAFDESKVTRVPRGSAGGGEFAGSAGGDPNQIASAQPSGKKATHDHYYRAGVDQMQGKGVPNISPKVQAKIDDAFKQNTDLFKNEAYYPNFRPDELKGTPQEVAANVIRNMANNIEYMYNKASDAIRENGLIWYPKVSDLTGELAKATGIPKASVVGAYAALSPNKSWDMNLELGKRMVNMWATLQDHKFDDDMKKQLPETLRPKGVKYDEGEYKQDVKDTMTALQGKSLSEVSDPVEKAWWMRTYDEAHSPAKDGGQQFHIFDPKAPNGEGKTATNNDGSPSKLVWQSSAMMANAVKALMANGNPEKISEDIGVMHKVRSFYNNILDPHSPNGDVTVDTHHVGVALMRPLGSTSGPVAQNFGQNPGGRGKIDPENWEPTSKEGKAQTGAAGLYGVYADATRLAAKELGVKDPNGLQAVVWEVKRQSLGKLGKGSDAARAAVDDEWKNYRSGKQTQAQTQDKIWDITQKEITRKAKTGNLLDESDD